MKFVSSLAGIMVVLAGLSMSCKASMKADIGPSVPIIGGTTVEAEASTTSVGGPPGSCVTVVFLDEEGRVIDRASGGVPLTVPTPPGTAQVRVEPCDSSPLVASGGRAPRRLLHAFVSLPCRLTDRLRFLVATVKEYGQDDAEALFSSREQEWTATPCSPLMNVYSMVEIEPDGADLLIRVAAQDEIQRLDFEWNGQAYASLSDATPSVSNGWHAATFRILAEDIALPTTTDVQNALRYEMDTLQRTGLSFDAAVTLDP